MASNTNTEPCMSPAEGGEKAAVVISSVAATRASRTDVLDAMIIGIVSATAKAAPGAPPGRMLRSRVRRIAAQTMRDRPSQRIHEKE